MHVAEINKAKIMTGRGRPRKPSEQKRREGTYRPDRDNQFEVDSAVPDPPPMLTGTSDSDLLNEWRRRGMDHWYRLTDFLSEENLISRLDGDALALLCLAFVEYEEADKEVAMYGLTVMSEKGGFYQHPAVGVRTNAWKKILRLCREFGMTPSARASLKTGDGQKEDNLDKALRELATG